MLLLALLALPLLAQDATPAGDSGSLDTVAATPAPLPTREPRPPVYATSSDDRAALQQFFLSALPQGQTRLLRVVGSDISAVTAIWQNRLIPFFPAADGAFYGLISAGMEAPTGPGNPFSASVSFSDGTRTTLSASFAIEQGAFIAQNVSLPTAKAYLLDPAVERSELARLESLTTRVTPERAWDETGFQLPIAAALTAPFGAFRVFNGMISTRHTGWDIRSTIGVPVLAMAAGRVVFADSLPIRGQYVMVDHGVGVYSGYAHCGEMLVVRGDTVQKGQPLCLAGDTGRTSAPHFHWEVAVNGQWVDPVQLLQMWMP
jgi:murein DD-endopeptidase MepM/ murein hydrolase activator NlpD